MEIFSPSAFSQSKKLPKVLFMSLLFLGVLASCKDEEADAPAPTKEMLLAGTTSKTWQIEGYMVDGETEPADACDADDDMIFFADKKMQSKDNAIKCDPADPDIANGTWTLSTDGGTLTLTDDVISLPFEINELTATHLHMTTFGVTFKFKAK